METTLGLLAIVIGIGCVITAIITIHANSEKRVYESAILERLERYCK